MNAMDNFEWNITNEGLLFDAMVGHKPVGINRHFHMAIIWKKLTDVVKKDVPSSKIWEHLETMYNMDGLNENEALHFSKEIRDFNLPDSEFGALKSKQEDKERADEKKSQKGRETPKNVKEATKREETAQKSQANSRTSKNERRDSRDKDAAKDASKSVTISKKESRKDTEKTKSGKGRTSQLAKEEAKKNKREESPRPMKRPTRGSMKPEDNSSGKGSPVTITPNTKRRRI